ncbi:MAG: hypothetical protein LW875_05095, partial [Proteobacteria bacterium]|nr:hypothetical protein [Pseudomonadota bacterium]
MTSKHFSSFWQSLFVGLFLTCLTICQALAIPTGYESYLDRPEVLKIQAKPIAGDQTWTEKLRPAHFTFVAQLLEMHPERELYFLARDSEHLYDVARLVTEGTKDAQRVHLLNVSRANMRDPLLKSYLAQHGITEEALVGGQKVLFVDTGFSGTIPKVIGENFSVSARQNLKTHLIVSSNEAHPSSRSFLVHLNPFVVNGNPASMHASVVSYEHMPRYTDRSTSFFAENGAYHPISNLKTANDGSVSKEISVKYIQDLKAAWSTHEVQKRYKIEKQAFKALYEITKTKASIEDLLRLKAQLESTFDQVFVEAMFKDAAEIQQRINESQSFEVTSLGYKESFTSASSKKNHLIKDYPQWANILEDPIGGIEHLVKTKDWVTLGALIDANVDHEFNKILAQNLFKQVAKGPQKSLQIAMIEKGDPHVLRLLAMDTFSKPHTAEMKDLIRLTIEKGDLQVLKLLAAYTFSKPHTAEMKDLIRLTIEKGDTNVLEKLATDTFSKPHTAEMKDLIRLTIEKGDTNVLWDLAAYTFSQPHTAEMKDLIRLTIEKGDTNVLELLAARTFSKPYTAEMKDLIRLTIEKGDTHVLRLLAKYTFSKPHTKNDPEYEILRRACEITDVDQRIKFMNQEMAKTGSFQHKNIDARLQVKDRVLINNATYEILGLAGEGRRGRVYLVRDTKGQVFALKVAKDNSADTLRSIQQESAKAKQWTSLNLVHSKVLVQAETYVLKSWVEGIRGDELIDRLLAGETQFAKAATQLLQLA